MHVCLANKLREDGRAGAELSRATGARQRHRLGDVRISQPKAQCQILPPADNFMKLRHLIEGRCDGRVTMHGEDSPCRVTPPALPQPNAPRCRLHCRGDGRDNFQSQALPLGNNNA